MIKKRVGDIRREFLRDFKIEIAVERLRKYEAIGLVEAGRNKVNDFREYGEKEAENLRDMLLFVELGVPMKALKNMDERAIDDRIASMELVLAEAKKRRHNGDNHTRSN